MSNLTALFLPGDSLRLAFLLGLTSYHYFSVQDTDKSKIEGEPDNTT